jgi:hypothetical protein
MKVAYFMEDTQRENDGYHERPLDPQYFGQQMTSTVNSRFEYGVGRTTKQVTKTLLGLWKRDYADSECQTLTFEEIA